MIQYLTSFIVYTLAMIGVLVIACTIYKKLGVNSPAGKNSILQITDMLRLPDRKTLYVIKCGKEQFLIASSNDKVSFISKLDENKEDKNPPAKSLLKELSDNNKTKRGNY